MKPCPHRGGQNHDQARFCGHWLFTIDILRQVESVERNEGQAHSPGIAVLLSFIWPGLGQLYNGQAHNGIAFAIAQLILWMILGPIMWLGILAQSLTGIFSLGILTAFWIYGMVDAKTGAARQALHTWEFRTMRVPFGRPQIPA